MMDIRDILKAGPINRQLVDEYVCQGCGQNVKVYKLEYRGRVDNHPHGCQCWEREQARQAVKERNGLKMARVFDENSLINPDLIPASFDSYEPPTQDLAAAKAEMMEYANSFSLERPRNLILTGDYGLGKSHLARSVVRVVNAAGFSGVFITVPDLLTKLKSTYRKDSKLSEMQILDLLKKVDLLVLDELGGGMKRATEDFDPEEAWAVNKLFEVINARAGRSTIYTTNFGGEELQTVVGPRNFSRILHNAHPIAFVGSDYRRKTMW